jgi:ribonuclease D
MLQRLNELQRVTWLDNDFKCLSQTSTYAVDLMHCWKRVKGKQFLKGQQLVILQQLAAWREKVAMEKDKPRRWIVNDDMLIELSRRKPHNAEQINVVRGTKENHLKRYYPVWFKTIQAAQKIPQAQWPSLPSKQKASAKQEILIDLLMMLVKYQAQQHHISPAAIASRKCIAQMIIEGKTHFSNDWRGNLLNNLFSDVLANRKTLSVQEGQLHIA